MDALSSVDKHVGVRQDQPKVVAEPTWSMAEFASRMQVVGKFSWSRAKPVGELFRFNFFGDLNQNAGYFSSLLHLHSFFRSGVSIRVMVNDTKFHAGKLVVR